MRKKNNLPEKEMLHKVLDTETDEEKIKRLEQELKEIKDHGSK